MGWKNWPYWLKGGIILSFIVLALFLLSGLITAINNNWNCEAPPCSAATGYCAHTLQNCFEQSNPFYLTYLNPEHFLLNGKVYGPGSFSFIQTIVIQILVFFVIGALIGLLVGKIKSKS